MWSGVIKQVQTMSVIRNLGSCPHPPMVLLCPGCLWEGGVGEAGSLGASGVSPTASAGLRWVVVELPDGWLVAYGPPAPCESLSSVPVKGKGFSRLEKEKKKDDNPKPMLHLAFFFFFNHLLPKAEALLALKKEISLQRRMIEPQLKRGARVTTALWRLAWRRLHFSRPETCS